MEFDEFLITDNLYYYENEVNYCCSNEGFYYTSKGVKVQTKAHFALPIPRIWQYTLKTYRIVIQTVILLNMNK